LFVNLAKPSFVVWFKPRFRTVSIIPGMEMAAPERTETRRGLAGLLKVLPEVFSNSTTPSSICFTTSGGRSLPYLQVSVVIVKPKGTGSSAMVIIAKT
jgi:hypothetical protein